MPTIASHAGIYGYGRSYAISEANATSVYDFAKTLATYNVTNVTPGKGLIINSKSVGDYEYTVRDSETINSGYDQSSYFTSVKDTTSSWIIIKGDLNISSGTIFTPPVRKLFTVIYVTGSITITGEISMTGRGANHSGLGNSGGLTAPVDIQVATGNFSSSSATVIDPFIPAAGGAGGAAILTGSPEFNDGADGINGGTGGGGTGRSQLNGIVGGGSAGTCFSGGVGSGGAAGNALSGPGGASGGAGGDGSASNGNTADGGSGNPGGSGSINESVNGSTGNDGTGGTLIIICDGELLGDGFVTSNGVSAVSSSSTSGGGASGGGSITIIYGTDSSSIFTNADGGIGNTSGKGGNGSIRLLKFS